MASAPIPMAVIAEAMRPQATAAQQAQTKTAISDTDKAEGTTSSNTTDSSDSAVDVKRDNNAAPVSATSATDSTIPHKLPHRAARWTPPRWSYSEESSFPCTAVPRRPLRCSQIRHVSLSSVIRCLAARDHMTERGPCSVMWLSISKKNLTLPVMRFQTVKKGYRPTPIPLMHARFNSIKPLSILLYRISVHRELKANPASY